MIILSLLYFGVFVAGDFSSKEPDLYFRQHFENLSKRRNPLIDDGNAWTKGREYIKDKMRYYGVRHLQEQIFNTTVTDEPFTGVNLIGIAEGNNITNDSVVVVGVDYDTNIIDNPLKDNTGGVACFLELMHLFFDKIYWNQYAQNYTVVFVAFDLNTREYNGEGMGKPGSYYFVHEWLLPFLNNETNPRDFIGAIILDSITTYNTKNDTQTLKSGFEEAFPEASESIEENGFKGDFLGLLYTSGAENNSIKKSFVTNYNKDRKMRPFRLQEMEVHLHLNMIGSDVLEMINHQSHYYFWTNIHDTYLPAFLLFDTDDDRTDPTLDVCNPISCEVEDFLTKERIAFMTKTTQTLMATLLDLSATHIDVPESSAELLAPTFQVMLLSILSVITAYLLKYV